jgi:hypothetical protein
MLKAIGISSCAALVLVTAGCYTRFAAFEPVSAAAAADTLTPSDSSQETCVWERDLSGFPRLRCYPAYYPRQWYLATYSPWWYHNNRHLYDAEKCPPYYYLDPSCGCCRYYLNNPDLVRTSKGGATAKETDSATATEDTDRVSVTVSSGASVHVPLSGSTLSADDASRPAPGRNAAAQGPADSLPAGAPDDSLAIQHRHDTMTVVPVNRLRRSLRGR